MFGYAGKILKVDLGTREIDTETFDAEFARTYMGGNGFAARLVYDSVPADAEPLSPRNTVVFALGPMNGTPIWGTSRGHIGSISPLTGYFADSNFGGDFAYAMRRAGFDAVVLSGASSTPVYLLLADGTASLEDANDLWGKTTGETHRLLIEREGNQIESACIGPAGENEVLFAGVIGSGTRRGAAGRCGLGAVMGSKRCKAIVARGSFKTPLADGDSLKTLLEDTFPSLKEKASALTDTGTPILVDMINTLGRLGTRNNSRETFDDAGRIDGAVIESNYKEKNVACRGCPVACGKLVRVPEGPFAGQHVKMPEYETLYAFGSMLENPDIVSIFNANAMCDEMGIDTISMGVTIAFVAECLEKGIVSLDEFGADIHFGGLVGSGGEIPAQDIAELVRLTALREGPGAYLAEGSNRLAQVWGGDAWKYLYAVQGLEIAGHSARGLRPMGLGYATSTRGGSHHDARPSYTELHGDPGFDGQAEYCMRSQHSTALGDSLVLCRFVMERGFGPPFDDFLLGVMKAVTGWEMTLDEIDQIGERIYTLERLINVRRGLDRTADTLPYRVTHDPIPAGPSEGRYCPEDTLRQLLDEYYDLRGWDRNGIPTDEKLIALGLH